MKCRASAMPSIHAFSVMRNKYWLILMATITTVFGDVSKEEIKEEWIEISAKLNSFDEEFWYSFEAEYLDENGNSEGTLNADAICPMAGFEIIKPKFSSSRSLQIIFMNSEEEGKKTIESVRNEKSLGKIYTFLVPPDFFDEEYGSIEFNLIKHFEPKS